jgi:predicted ATPase
MSASMASAARRFVWLIDVLYDQRVKLVMKNLKKRKEV